MDLATSVPRTVVLDTNIVLDIFLFSDPVCEPIRAGLMSGALHWLAIQHMRNELERVLDYSHLQPKLALYALSKGDVLAAFDRHAHLVDVAPRVALVCKDPDDQCFIDLAVAHQALLLSKDKAVLALRKRLLAQGVTAQTAIQFSA
ncbi:putative toxin-antitoxin system toxin component, PIN family [Variovorax sp. HJSM1_2]|uniref:putative toxin-antitoxin system toxin component, PIN family n=1 Tax=Variovorax sp. HJSM1_2 TaxID=3366263 RepID=UPI003BEDAB8E